MPFNKSIGIIGVGHFLPETIVHNQHFVERGLDTTPEWIETRSGIKTRHVSAKNEATSDLAYKAAETALKNAELNSSQIDFIIVATATPDHYGFPSTACIVQKKLGIKKSIPCFDITVACSGFAYGLSLAYSKINSGFGQTGLVIGAETISHLLDWSDRRTAILFGDGAGAAIVGSVLSGGFKQFDMGSDGFSSDILGCKMNQNIERFNGEKVTGESPTIHMDGQAVFKKGIAVVLKSVKKVLSESNLTSNDIDYFVCHQANYRILESVAKRLGIDMAKFLINIDTVGNTSAASIPLVLGDFLNQKKIKKGDRLCLVGFGAGFTWSSIIIEWSY